MNEQQIHQQRLSSLIAAGAKLPDAPDGPVLDCFNALELAQGIEHELQRAGGRGLTKIQLNMNFNDAQAMASFLRRAALLGA